MSDDLTSDNEETSDNDETKKRSGAPRVQPTPPGVDPPPEAPSDRVVQPVPPEFSDDTTFSSRDSVVDEAIGDVSSTESTAAVSAEGLPATAPYEVVIVPSAVAEPVDLPPTEPSSVAQPVTAPIETASAAVAATNVQAAPPPETTVLRSEIVPAANRSGPQQDWAIAPAGEPPRGGRRSVVPLFVLAIVAAMLLGGGVAAWWVSRNAPDRAATSESPATTPPGTAGSTTSTAAANPTVATTSPPATTTPVPSSTASPATAAPTPAPPPTQNTVPGDLALDQPMRRPSCDGQFIVITANAVTPGKYPQEVAAAQQRFIGAAYLRTDQTCSSLRAADDLGNPIYSVYYGPFPTLAKACEIRNQVGGESYIKILDGSTPFAKIWEC